MSLADWMAWGGFVSLSVAVGLAIFWGVGAFYHLRYYRARADAPETWKCQPKRFLKPAQQREAMIMSSSALSMGGIISGSIVFLLSRGLETPLYYRVSDHGWLYTIASSLLFFVVVDALAYYCHRALHQKWLFRRIHRWHHRYVATTPFVATAVHPVELLTFQALTFLPLFLFPVHAAAAAVVLIYVLAFNVIDHSGVDLDSRLPWQPSSRFHDDHHAYFHCNFGQHLTLWDRLHGTLRRADRVYGESVFGGKGRALSEAAAEAPAQSSLPEGAPDSASPRAPEQCRS